jgi:hypothetical protein
LLEGTDQANCADALPAVATAPLGALGGVGTKAVKAALAIENWLVPNEFEDATRN